MRWGKQMDNYELLEYNLAEFMTSDMQEEFLQFFHFQNINEFKEQYVHSKKTAKRSERRDVE